MGTAFYAEAQIWPWMRDEPLRSELVMFAMNWDDRPDFVCHVRHVECDREDPHTMIDCGRFTSPPLTGSGVADMGWSIGYDSNWQRDIGYGVPAFCDHPQ